jgi:hypothetical protein
MKKKIVYICTGLLLAALINTAFITSTFGKPLNQPVGTAGIEPDGTTYHCYWWAEEWFIGPMGRDCMGCVEVGMTEPSIPGTCGLNLQE